MSFPLGYSFLNNIGWCSGFAFRKFPASRLDFLPARRVLIHRARFGRKLRSFLIAPRRDTMRNRRKTSARRS
jgi:hypothetical protein